MSKSSAFFVMVDPKGIEPSTLRMRTSPWNFFRAFPAIFSCFGSAPLHLWASLTMLFPCGPGRCVVGSVVRNAPQPLPVSFADRDGERFSYLWLSALYLWEQNEASHFCAIRGSENWGTVNKKAPGGKTTSKQSRPHFIFLIDKRILLMRTIFRVLVLL